ncbi:MAG: DUF3025 domain-containing protein [Pseudomonadota bacterium]
MQNGASFVDWNAPWLAPYGPVGRRVATRWAAGGDLATALNAEREHRSPWPQLAAGPLRFVPQAGLPSHQAYEAFIFAHADVPTRDNLHDFFNGLVWLHHPALKRQLNAQHAAQLAPLAAEAGATGVGAGRRGPVRDALTLFDENAAVWQAPGPLFAALQRRDWDALFQTHRALWRASTLTLFGHALLEKLCQPRKGITAHVWWVPPGQDLVASLCAQLTPSCLVQRPWAALPVLGVPGWWPANEAAAFYTDSSVFRPRV